jgi:NIPSNAP
MEEPKQPQQHPTLEDPSATALSRRGALVSMAALAAALALSGQTSAEVIKAEITKRAGAMIVCVIRYQIDPSQRAEFKKHGENLISIVPRCGGHLVGYFLPYEGTSDIAWGLIAFDGLASYEAYRGRLRKDEEAVADAEWVREKRIILREERNFVEVVDGTFNVPPRHG